MSSYDAAFMIRHMTDEAPDQNKLATIRKAMPDDAVGYSKIFYASNNMPVMRFDGYLREEIANMGNDICQVLSWTAVPFGMSEQNIGYNILVMLDM